MYEQSSPRPQSEQDAITKELKDANHESDPKKIDALKRLRDQYKGFSEQKALSPEDFKTAQESNFKIDAKKNLWANEDQWTDYDDSLNNYKDKYNKAA